MRANIWKSYLFSALRAMMLIMPIIVLFFLDIGLTMTQLFIAQAIFSIVLVVMEIPSGYISDTLGRKKTLIIGAWTTFFGYAIYSFATNFWEVVLGEVLIGIGASFISGTDTAMLYDSLLELREEGTYKRLEGRRQALSRFFEGASSIAGGLFAILSLRWPFYVQTGLLFFFALTAHTFTDPEVKRYRAHKGHLRGMMSIIKESFTLDQRLRWLIIYSAIISATTLGGVWLLQPYLKASGLAIGWFGIVWATMYLVAAGASLVAHNVDEYFGPRKLLFALLLLPLGASLLLSSTLSLWMLLVIPAYQIVRAFQSVVVSDYLNKQLVSEKRATVLSTKNFLYRILFAVMSPFIGWMVDAWSIQTAFFWSAILFAILGLIAYLLLGWAHHRK
jgi:MFS family permease